MSTTTVTPTPASTAPTAPEHGVVRNPWLVVTLREIMVKLTDRNFILSTVLTLVMIAASFAVSAFLGGRTTEYTVATTSADAAVVVEASRATITADDSGDTLAVEELADEAAARAAVEAGDVDAALLPGDDGWVLLGNDEVDSTLRAALTDGAATTALEANASAAGTTPAELTAGSAVTTELLEGSEDMAGAKYVVGFVFAFLFYISAIIFGMAIANSVLEEKQNRVVEILATAVPIRQLLYGKVLGNSLLAFAQIALYAIVALIAVNVTGAADDLGWIAAASGWFVLFFVAGFAALASVWAVLGSLASRSEDLQSNTGPITGVLVGILFIGFFAEGVWLTVASYVPVVSSVTMPIRMLDGNVPLWEPLVSLVITAVTAYLLLRLGERVYQRAVMQGGTALKWRQALKLEV